METETEMENPTEEMMDASAVAQFEELTGTTVGSGSAPLSTLYDLTLPVAIELGRTSMTVQEVLHLGRGSVVELDRLAGEPVDVYVGDRRFAEGEVVVLGEHFGIRITRIVSRHPVGENAA
jgi:flagellar motor switch protein FliN/FliY